MRQFFLLAPFLLVVGAPIANAAPKPVSGALCPDPTKALEDAKFRRLGDLPPAEAFRAVYRIGEGCSVRSIPASDKLGKFPKESGQNPRL